MITGVKCFSHLVDLAVGYLPVALRDRFGMRLLCAVFGVVLSCFSADASGEVEKNSQETTAELIRDDLFKCNLVDKSRERLHHSVLARIDFNNCAKISKIPGLALCSIKSKSTENDLIASSRADREHFMKAIISVVKCVNRRIMEQRDLVLLVMQKKKDGMPLSPQEDAKFKKICSFYRTSSLQELLKRVAPVPVSLAVAQAALESGFGSCQVMQKNNAFFGMMRNSKYLYSYNTLFESVIAYSKTLNVNICYEKFRQQRYAMISPGKNTANKNIYGEKLVGYLGGYSENRAYAARLAKIFREHDLAKLDEASKV
jgi:uncharacterized FlgJ-related protein